MAKITDDMDTGNALLGFVPHPFTKSINIIMGMSRTHVPNERRIGFFCVSPSVMIERPIGISGHRSRYKLIIKMNTKKVVLVAFSTSEDEPFPVCNTPCNSL